MRTFIIIFFLSLFFWIDTNAQNTASVDGFKSELKSIKKSKGSESLEYIDKLTELSIFYSHLEDYKNALKQIEKANKLIEKKLRQLQLVKNHASFKPEITYPLSIKILATKYQIHKKSNNPTSQKITLSATPSIDFGLKSKNLNLVEIILGSLYYYFDFNSSFFQKKWTTACSSQLEVPKELRFLKFLEKYSKANSGEFSKKHNNSIIYLAIFYKKNNFKAEFDAIKPLVDKIAPDTLSKLEINSDYFPRFPGCEIEGLSIKKRKLCADQKLLKFIYSNIKYPKIAFDKNIRGTVVIKFTVTHEGEIKDATIVRDVGGGCGDEALRIINLMNSLPTPWTSGIVDNKLISVQYQIPIQFILNR